MVGQLMLVIIASKIIAEPSAVVIKSSFIPTAATAIIKLNLEESKTPAEMLSLNECRTRKSSDGTIFTTNAIKSSTGTK
jgi:hypothetical protein